MPSPLTSISLMSVSSAASTQQSEQPPFVEVRGGTAFSEERSSSRGKRSFGAVGEPVPDSTAAPPPEASHDETVASIQDHCPPGCFGCTEHQRARRIEQIHAETSAPSRANAAHTDLGFSLLQAQNRIRDLEEMAAANLRMANSLSTLNATLSNQNATLYKQYKSKTHKADALRAELDRSKQQTSNLRQRLSDTEAVLVASIYKTQEEEESNARLSVTNEELRARLRKGTLTCPESNSGFYDYLQEQIASLGRMPPNPLAPACTINCEFRESTPYPSEADYDKWAQASPIRSSVEGPIRERRSRSSGLQQDQTLLHAPAPQRSGHALAHLLDGQAERACQS